MTDQISSDEEDWNDYVLYKEKQKKKHPRSVHEEEKSPRSVDETAREEPDIEEDEEEEPVTVLGPETAEERERENEEIRRILVDALSSDSEDEEEEPEPIPEPEIEDVRTAEEKEGENEEVGEPPKKRRRRKNHTIWQRLASRPPRHLRVILQPPLRPLPPPPPPLPRVGISPDAPYEAHAI